jgi:peptidylprolyl isomerase
MPKGVKIRDIVPGSGRVAERGMTVLVKLRTFLSGGDEVFAEYYKGQSTLIDLGRRETIAGLRYGIEGMRVGGHRTLVIIPHLAYGAEGMGVWIPPHAVLHYDVELLEIREPGEKHPEDYPPGKSLHIFRPGEAAQSISRLQFGLHEGGQAGVSVTTPVPGYSWRHARHRNHEFQPDNDLTIALFKEALTMPRNFPEDCLYHDDLWSDLSEPANGITRDLATGTRCISISVYERAEIICHYSMKESSNAWLSSRMCRALSELMEPHPGGKPVLPERTGEENGASFGS